MSGGVNQRRHFLYKDQVNEDNVDQGSDTHLLNLWLARREQLMQEEHLSRYLVFFWALAKPTKDITLSSEHYVNLFSRICMALITAANDSEQVIEMAQRDWCYDSHGSTMLTLQMFKHALYETAELLLPVESDVSMFSSFFLELRDAIAIPDVLEGTGSTYHPDSALASSSQMYEAIGYKLRSMGDTRKIRGAFLQKLSPTGEQLALINGLPSPDLKTMSLKQLLLAYNPRKNALSRKFSSLFSTSSAKTASNQSVEVPLTYVSEGENTEMKCRTSPAETSALLNKVSQDPYDYETAVIEALNEFPALRVAVVGPPGTGKTRVAKYLANKLDLQYCSLSVAVTNAITSKERQCQLTAEKQQKSFGGVKLADSLSGVSEIASEFSFEQDALFSDDDYEALRGGEALPRKKALALLVRDVQNLTRSGVGVVLDDVYPYEVVGEFDLDYLVTLDSSREDAWKHFGGLEVDPSTKNVYSQRELAMIFDCDDILREKGMADVARMKEWDTTISQPKTIVNDVKAQVLVEQYSAEVVEGNIEEGKAASEAQRELTVAERNDVQAPVEVTVPLYHLHLSTFNSRYLDYLDRSASTRIAHGRTHIVVVLATQSLQSIISQCVYEISNNSYGLCRSVKSRVVVPVTIPQEMVTAGRADSLRWLLYGDWGEMIASLPPTLASSITTQSRRQLSRWRQCCLVTYVHEGVLVSGDPLYSSYFSGRVYLSASAKYREMFCAHPQSYLNVEPPVLPLTRKIWLISPGSLDPNMLTHVEAAVNAKIIDARTLLDAHPKLCGAYSELLQGQSLSSKQCADIVADELTTVGMSWVLTGLMPSTDALLAFKERQCLPDVVVSLAHDEDIPMKITNHEHNVELMRARNDRFISSRTEFVNIVASLGIPIKSSPIYLDPMETCAALIRALNPVASSVDTIDDGTMNAIEEGLSTFTPPELTENESGETNSLATSNRKLMGETAQFCPVSWFTHQILIPGQPSFVTSFNQKYYSFANQQALTRFQRDPTRYITNVLHPSATQMFTPLILFLGARGCDQDQLVERLSASLTQRQRVVVVDYKRVIEDTRNRLKVQSLFPSDKLGMLTTEQIYSSELQSKLSELRKCVDSNTLIILNGLGNGNTGTNTESTIPSVEILSQLYELGVYPSLVVALDANEEAVVARQLDVWKDQVVSRKRRLPKEKLDNEVGTADDIENETLEELEEEERVKFQEQFKCDQEAIDKALKWLYERGGTIAKHVRLTGTERAIDKTVHKIVQEHLISKNTLFEYSERVSMDQSLRLLRSGDALIGHHGTTCPLSVRIHPQSVQKPFESAFLVRGRLYFPRDATALHRCEKQVSLPMEVPMWAPSFRPTCCVVGPPGVGRTRLAFSLAEKYGVVYVSPKTAIDWALQCNGGTELWDKLKAAKEPLEAELVHEVIVTRLCSAECQRNGWVLDDYLLSWVEVNLSLNPVKKFHAIHPGLIFMLDGNMRSSWTTLQRHYLNLSPEANTTVDEALRYEKHVAAFAKYQTHRLNLLNSWITTFGTFHIRQIETSNVSSWHIWTQASRVVDELIWRSQGYRSDYVNGKVANLYGILRPLKCLVEKQHPVFSNFCPVSLATSRFHWTCSQQRMRCVEFKDTIYWLAPNETRFHVSPTAFLDTSLVECARQQLADAPVGASLLSLLSVPDCDFPEMKGYCPVTFKHGTGDTDWAAIVKGSVFYRVSIGQRVFYCVSEEARRHFLCEPTLYEGVTLPVKLPPLLSTSLLAKKGIGRLEQELTDVLNETLLLLGTMRPKYLQASVAASSCVYLALILKIRAKTLPPRVRTHYEEKLIEFERECRLGETLKRMMAPLDVPAACGSGMKGVRAVLTGVQSEDGRESGNGVVKIVAAKPISNTKELTTVQQRFDELTQARSHSLVVFTRTLPHNSSKSK